MCVCWMSQWSRPRRFCQIGASFVMSFVTLWFGFSDIYLLYHGLVVLFRFSGTFVPFLDVVVFFGYGF